MPIYEYACAKCKAEFEVEQRITDDPVKTCPKCRSRKVKRLISRTSFVLKGGGWYSDLYSSSKGKRSDADKSESASDSGSDKSSESTSKPSDATKADTSKSSKSETKPGNGPKGKGKGKAA